MEGKRAGWWIGGQEFSLCLGPFWLGSCSVIGGLSITGQVPSASQRRTLHTLWGICSTFILTASKPGAWQLLRWVCLCAYIYACVWRKSHPTFLIRMHGSLRGFQRKLPRAVERSPPIQPLCPELTTAATAASLEIPRKKERKKRILLLDQTAQITLAQASLFAGPCMQR